MNAINNCPPNLSKGNMSAISAPYNFVPLNRRVLIPEWGKQVSHDWPFEDGISGEIHYSLIAHSPLLVGGHQTPASENAPGEVHPFKLPDGRYAIPGSSLKGMLRAIIEIAGFGRMRMVDEIRPGLRDITGKNVAASYTEKVRNRVEAGFLRQRPDGGQEIVPCKMARVSHRELESALEIRKPIFRARINVAEKYRIWQQNCPRKNLDPSQLNFNIGEKGAMNLGHGAKSGFPVFTGQISDSTKKGGKYKDFIFYDRAESNPIPVTQQTWRDFLLIHGDEEGKDDMSWPGYWRQKFRNGEEVPVFYVQDGDLLRIGLAYMPKLAGDFTTHDLIRHASDKHLDAPGGENDYDLADLLFGAIGENQNDALRGRVSCETAMIEGNAKEQPQPATILNGPKPTYFPNYIEQKSGDNRTLKGSQYATYMDTDGNSNPVVSGFKRYPARPAEKTGVQAIQSSQEGNKKVQVTLFPLPEKTRFKGRIVFHNLKPQEFGALLWAMTWGGNEQLRHGLGMGKPFGFGQVQLQIDETRSRVIPNAPDKPEENLYSETWRKAFVSYMENKARNELGQKTGWLQSAQMLNLLSMADPESARRLPAGMALRHMCLNAKENINEFTWAKQNSLILSDYAQATKYQRRLKEAEDARRKQQAELEAQRREEEVAARKKKEQEDFDALPESEKAAILFEKFLDGLPEALTKDRYPELVAKINEYLKQAVDWSTAEKSEVVRRIEQAYDRYGWGTPGLKAARKKKQGEKKRAALASFLGDSSR